MSNFGRTKKEAKRNYQDFVENVDVKALEKTSKQVTGGFLLGDADFVNWVKETFLAGKKDEKEIPQLKKLKPKVSLEKVIQTVTQEFNCSPEMIIAKGCKKNKAREVALYVAREMSGMSCKDLGEYFGGVSGALITIMHSRIADESKQNRRLKRRIDRVRNQIFNI